MKMKYLSLILIPLLFSGCGKYQYTSYFYSTKSPFDSTSEMNIRGSIEASLVESKRGLFSQWSDLYSAPYTMSFRIYLKNRPIHSLAIYSIKLSDEKSVIWEVTPEKPLIIPIKKRYDTAPYFEALYSVSLDESLDFKDNRRLDLQVEWEIPETKERQIFKTEFVSEKSNFTCSKLDHLIE